MTTPKRRVKKNIWGNYNGYEGTKKTQAFGTCEIAAAYWLITGVVDFNEGFSPERYLECKSVLTTIF